MRSDGTSAPSDAASDRLAARGAFPWLAVLAATVFALALRLPAALQDPWIDEVWSWGLARTRANLGDVFAIRSSNSHALITLWIRLVGDQPSFLFYRLPSLVAGVACVPVAARIAFRHGRAAAIAAAWIVAVSFLGVVYATEARGYAVMVVCSLLALECAWSWLDTGRRRWLAASWACAVVGVLAQTLYVVGWAAIALAVVVRIRREGRDRALVRAASFGAVPVACFGAWWFVYVRHLFNAGAPPWDLASVLTETCAWSLGLPIATWAAVLGAGIVVGVLVLDARRLAVRGDPGWIAQVGVVVVGSIATIVLLRSEYLAPRYFLVPLAFWCLSLARVLGHLAERGNTGRAQTAVVLVLFAAGNLAHTIPFLRVGRGEIGQLVRRMAELGTARPIVVTGNYDFNVGALLEWHARSLPAGREVVYLSHAKSSANAADFAVVDQPRFESEPPRTVRIGERDYELVGSSRHAGPSGSDWAVYQRSRQ